MLEKRLDGIVLDFDGTISKNSVNVAFRYTYEYINRLKPIPFVFVYNYFKNITAFQMGEAIRQLFSAFGLAEKTEECLKNYTEITSYQDIQIEIEKDFFDFVRFCQKNSLFIKVFSSAGPKQNRFKPLFEVLKEEDFLSYSHRPKADPTTFKDMVVDLKLDVTRCMYIDDTPLALWSAKTAGFTTAMMLNQIFTKEDFIEYRQFIDYKINSFRQLKSIVKKGV